MLTQCLDGSFLLGPLPYLILYGALALSIMWHKVSQQGNDTGSIYRRENERDLYRSRKDGR
ncbi:MAG: hypothetical protein EZS28_040371, partial [Streblomastix strix]